MIIDTHVHFWRYEEAAFGWIAAAALKRDFLPADYAADGSDAGVSGCVAVEARQCLEETEQLLRFAAERREIRGVVGWLPLVDFGDAARRDAAAAALERFVAEAAAVAVRHVVQDEPDDGFILREDFNAGVDAVGRAGLAYEILVFARQLPQAIRFADRHPGMRLVLDHLGKPGADFAFWWDRIRELARRDQVWCKVSGLVTEVGCVDFRPYIETVLEAFGPERVMWGGDWPVLKADMRYRAWLEACREVLPDACFGETARRFYRLKDGECGKECER